MAPKTKECGQKGFGMKKERTGILVNLRLNHIVEIGSRMCSRVSQITKAS